MILKTLEDLEKDYTYEELSERWMMSRTDLAVQDADHAINLHLFPNLREMAIELIKVGCPLNTVSSNCGEDCQECGWKEIMKYFFNITEADLK